MLRLSLDTLPGVTMLGQIRQRMGWENAVARTGTHMLVLVREGDMRFTTGGGCFALSGGEYLLLPKDAAYRVRSENSCQYAFVHFELGGPILRVDSDAALRLREAGQMEFVRAQGRFPYSLPRAARADLLLPMSGKLGEEQEKIWMLLTECDMYRYEMTPNAKLRIDLRFGEILALLEQNARPAATAVYPPTLSRILFYLHEHYMEPVTLAGLSEEFQLSRQYIMRLFQRHLRITVTHYIQRVKLTHAQELLRYSTFRVQEVAEILGFGNAYYFCRLFKKQFGMTPTAFIRLEMTGEKRSETAP